MTSPALDEAVFDRARIASNDNHYIRLVYDDPEDVPRRHHPKPFRHDEIPVEIPADKASARALLDRLGVGASVSMTMACANANLPVDCGWRGPMSEPMMVWLPPRQPPKKRKIAANDNETSPLLEALRRDGRHADIPLVMRYRMLVDVVGATPFDSEVEMAEDGVNVQARSLKLSGKAFRDSFTKMTATKLPGGEISYREQRQTAKQIVTVGQRMTKSDEEGAGRTQVPLRLAASEDQRIARIDGVPILAALRAGMGDLIYFFEDVVLGQWTLTALGESLGYKHKARSRDGKALAYAAIDRLRDQWRIIDRQMEAEAAACERRVEDRRAELAAERAAYLGLAA